jgi:hypothetical protein
MIRLFMTDLGHLTLRQKEGAVHKLCAAENLAFTSRKWAKYGNERENVREMILENWACTYAMDKHPQDKISGVPILIWLQL